MIVSRSDCREYVGERGGGKDGYELISTPRHKRYMSRDSYYNRHNAHIVGVTNIAPADGQSQATLFYNELDGTGGIA